jgi:hypothetical protein
MFWYNVPITFECLPFGGNFNTETQQRSNKH